MTEKPWDLSDVDRWSDVQASEAGHSLARLATWWRDSPTTPLGASSHTDLEYWAASPLLKRALEGGPPLRVAEWSGNLTAPAEQLIAAAVKVAKCRVVRQSDYGNDNGNIILASDTTMISLGFQSLGQTTGIKVMTVDEEVCRKVSQLFDACVVEDDPRKGVVFMLAKGMMGYKLRRLGLAGSPLERGNYTPEVLSAYDHVVTDLASPNPCGRLVILSGPPGTGKTFLVRALLREPRAAYILVPSTLVAELSGPDILPTLAGAKNEFAGPLVMIIEDADKVLVKRHDGEMGGISSLLNLGDGILGSVLDIRIVATTNAEKIEMDPATRRPGRLCRYIDVGDLSREGANQAFKRLTGKADFYDEGQSIAQVYLDARSHGWEPPAAVPERPAMNKAILG